jgi:TPR repeat protein
MVCLAGVFWGCSAGPLRNLQRGCDQGSAEACLQLGVAYYEGRDDKGHILDLDYYKARKAYAQACQREDGAGCYSLGYMNQKGEGGPVNKVLSIDLYRRGCELGFPKGCGRAAVAYRNGAGVERDLVLATKLARQGCDKEDRDACEQYKQLSVMPGSGGVNGLTAEVQKLADSCDAGSADACFEVAMRYDDGKGVGQDKQKAATAYKSCCDKGDMRGCHNLGVMLIDGEGIPRDLGNGLKLINQACEKGQHRSCEVLVARLERACTQEDADACTVIGSFFIKGEKGLDANINKGVDYLRRGCKLGDKDGCDLLRKLGLDPN